MFVSEKSSSGKNIKSIPMVEFDNVDLEMKISNLFKVDRNIYEYIGLILLKIGFKSEDKILLNNYDRENHSFDCMVNGEDYYHIRLEDNEYREIILNKFNVQYGYKFIPNERAELGMLVSLGRYNVKYPNGLNFTRYLSDTDIKFKFEYKDYCLELELVKPDDVKLPLFDKKGHYNKYRLDNEEELINYLGSLQFPISIVDVYKILCSKYLGDISKYPKFILKSSRLCRDNNFMVTDLISLNYGELDKFGMTSRSGGMTVFVDKFDNWSFQMLSEYSIPVDFVMSSSNGKLSCTFSASTDVDLKHYTSDIIQSDINVALEEIEEVKKRVRSIFGNKGSN